MMTPGAKIRARVSGWSGTIVRINKQRSSPYRVRWWNGEESNENGMSIERREDTMTTDILLIDPRRGPKMTTTSRDGVIHFASGYVGGNVEVVRVPTVKDFVLLVNEDGAALKLDPNPLASAIAGQMILGVAMMVFADVLNEEATR